MADAKKCDRCGAFYISDGTPKYSVLVEPSIINCGGLVDLCPSCVEALDRFMTLEPNDIYGGCIYNEFCGGKYSHEHKG